MPKKKYTKKEIMVLTMANAKKCDICGSLYEKNISKYKDDIIKGIWLATNQQHYAETYGITGHKDLCDNIKKLDLWVSGKADIVMRTNDK